MKKTAILLLILITLAALTVILSGCGPSVPPSPTYYPDTVTVNFYDDPSEPPIASKTYNRSEFGGSAESMARKIGEEMPIPDRETYEFLGYTLHRSEEYPFDTAGWYMFRSEENMQAHPYLDWYEQFYNFYYELYSNVPVSNMEFDLYACYEVPYFSFVYYLGDREFTLIERDESLSLFQTGYRRNFICTYYHNEYAKGGYNETESIIGWRDSLGRQVFDFAGKPLYSAEEMFLMYTNYASRNEPGWTLSCGSVILTPIISDRFALLTLDYGREGDFEKHAMAYFNKPAEDADLPFAYVDGKCVAGWSQSPDEYVPFKGEVSGDKTLYAVWKNAKELVFKSGDVSIKVYVTEDNEIIYDIPEGYEKMDILRWYLDEKMTVATTLRYSSVMAGQTVYGTLEEAYREITLAPQNGDSPYTVTVSIHKDKNNFKLPEWQGYEIEGWYLDRACDGERFELDFDSVTDGATYYAKWVRSE